MRGLPRDKSAGWSVTPRLLQAARTAVLVQALALLAVIGLAVPGYLDFLLHPISCKPDLWCMDFRGFTFEASVFFLGPPTLLLVAAFWLWRRPRRWPAALPILVDVAVIGVVLIDLVDFSKSWSAEPNIAVQVLLGLIPAFVTLTLAVGVLRPWNSGHQLEL